MAVNPTAHAVFFCFLHPACVLFERHLCAAAANIDSVRGLERVSNRWHQKVSHSPYKPYDDNLSDIRVPVLYIGAAGGVRKLSEYTTQLLGSSDVTTVMMQTLPDADAQNDFGHTVYRAAVATTRMATAP